MAEKFLHILQKGISKLQRLIYYGFWVAPRFEKNVIAQFHEIYCYPDVLGGTWGNTYWLGVPVQKCIFDMWVYQEILFEVRPDIIIECGTANGGGTLFLSSVCDVIGSGNIVSVDIEDKKDRPQHKRIKYLLGSSTSKEIVEQVRQTVSGDCKVMVILDSDHHKEHVLNELRIYNELVTEGSYIIVEDTNLNGHPVRPDFGPGPMEAVEEFLKENKNFIIDKSKEKFYLTFNPKGYLKRIR